MEIKQLVCLIHWSWFAKNLSSYYEEKLSVPNHHSYVTFKSHELWRWNYSTGMLAAILISSQKLSQRFMWKWMEEHKNQNNAYVQALGTKMFQKLNHLHSLNFISSVVSKAVILNSFNDSFAISYSLLSCVWCQHSGPEEILYFNF